MYDCCLGAARMEEDKEMEEEGKQKSKYWREKQVWKKDPNA